MRTFIAVLVVSTFAFGSAAANVVQYEISGSIDGDPGWPEFTGSERSRFQIDFTLDTTHLVEDYNGLYLSITPTNVSYEVGGVTENLTTTDVALEVERGYPQMYFSLLHGDDRQHWQFSVTDNGLNPLYSEGRDGPVLRTGTFDNLTLSRADIWPAGTLDDIALNVSDARIVVTPVPESPSCLLALAALSGIAIRLAVKKLSCHPARSS